MIGLFGASGELFRENWGLIAVYYGKALIVLKSRSPH